jgi:hypothetical protein
MGKIVISDDCLTPDRYIRLNYSGPNPWEVANKITDLIRPFFHVSASGTNNFRLNWDISGDPITFYSRWWVNRKASRYSSIWVDFTVQGEKFRKTNEGSFVLVMHGRVRTTFSGWGAIINPIWHMYSYLFYNRARRNYIAHCRNNILNFRNEIKKHFNVEATSEPTSVGTYG